MEEEKLWRRDQQAMRDFLQRMPAGRIRAMAQRMSSLDAALKGRVAGAEPWRDLTSLVLGLCGIFPFSRRV